MTFAESSTSSPPWISTWGPLVGSCAVALIALMGVLITVMVARRTFREEQAEKRRDRQRTLIADLVAAIWKELPQQHVKIVATSRMTLADFTEYAHTDSVATLTTLIGDRSSLLLHARMEIRAKELADLLSEIDRLYQLMKNDPSGPIVIDTRASGEARTDAVGKQIEFLYALDNLVRSLEERAVTLLPVHIDSSRPRSIRSWFRRGSA